MYWRCLSVVPSKTNRVASSGLFSELTLSLLESTFSRPPSLCSPHRWSPLVLPHCPQQWPCGLGIFRIITPPFTGRATFVRLVTSSWALCRRLLLDLRRIQWELWRLAYVLYLSDSLFYFILFLNYTGNGYMQVSGWHIFDALLPHGCSGHVISPEPPRLWTWKSHCSNLITASSRFMSLISFLSPIQLDQQKPCTTVLLRTLSLPAFPVVNLVHTPQAYLVPLPCSLSRWPYLPFHIWVLSFLTTRKFFVVHDPLPSTVFLLQMWFRVFSYIRH